MTETCPLNPEFIKVHGKDTGIHYDPGTDGSISKPEADQFCANLGGAHLPHILSPADLKGLASITFLVTGMYECMYSGCSSWNAHETGHPTGPGGVAHQKWVQCLNPEGIIGTVSRTLTHTSA